MSRAIEKALIKNILISRTDNLGDAALTLPLIKQVKKVFEGSRVFFCAKSIVLTLLIPARMLMK
jgi:ADP-heptose:LPS heptosyltransferase